MTTTSDDKTIISPLNCISEQSVKVWSFAEFKTGPLNCISDFEPVKL